MADRVRDLAAPLPPDLEALLEKALIDGCLWVWGKDVYDRNHQRGKAHRVEWNAQDANEAAQILDELFEFGMAKTSCGRLGNIGRPDPAFVVRYSKANAYLRRLVNMRLAAETLRHLRESAADGEICSFCLRWEVVSPEDFDVFK